MNGRNATENGESSFWLLSPSPLGKIVLSAVPTWSDRLCYQTIVLDGEDTVAIERPDRVAQSLYSLLLGLIEFARWQYAKQRRRILAHNPRKQADRR